VDAKPQSGAAQPVLDLPAEIVRLTCDHLDDAQTAAAFAKVRPELDVLVNAAWGGYERMVENGAFTWSVPFWQQPMHRWTSMIDGGVRAAFVCAAHGSRLMVPQKRGLIVNISFWAAQKHVGNVLYGISKAATDKLTSSSAVVAPNDRRIARMSRRFATLFTGSAIASGPDATVHVPRDRPCDRA